MASCRSPVVSVIKLQSANELAPRVQQVLAAVREKLAAILPGTALEHIGATAIPGAITKGDVDIVLRVAPGAFPAIVDKLRAHFAVRQAANWNENFASFGDDMGYGLPLGIQVVIRDSDMDFLTYLRDYLADRPDVREEYNRVKLQNADQGPESYWKAKDAFFAKILAARRR